jgi:ribose transport system substrate-binding protein
MKLYLFIALMVVVSATSCRSKSDAVGGGEQQFAFVTNGVASFWDVAAVGALDAGKQYGIDIVVEMPTKSVEDQQKIVEQLLADQIDGIAISPINPADQEHILNKIGENTLYLTHDSDAPDTNRLCYIGMDNYVAGRMCGKLVKEALPDGGEIMIFVGRLGQLNAKDRRQGLIDEILDRSDDSSRYDPPNKVVGNEKYTIVGTRLDQFDYPVCKKEAEQTIADYPNIGCMVGLFGYNPPLILEAVKGAGKLGQIKIVAFDEDMITLNAIEAGTIVGTVVQNPYQYGFRSMELLYQLSQNDRSGIPESGIIEIPARTIRAAEVVEFRDELVGLLNQAKTDDQISAINAAAKKEKAAEAAAVEAGTEADVDESTDSQTTSG